MFNVLKNKSFPIPEYFIFPEFICKKMSTVAAWKGQSIMFCSNNIFQHSKEQERNLEKHKSQRFFFLYAFLFVCLLLFYKY